MIERDFKRDDEGRTVFFAKGLRKPGYIIADKKKETEIKNIILIYSSLVFSLYLLWFLALFFIKRSLAIFFIWVVILGLIHFGWYRRKIDL